MFGLCIKSHRHSDGNLEPCTLYRLCTAFVYAEPIREKLEFSSAASYIFFPNLKFPRKCSNMKVGIFIKMKSL